MRADGLALLAGAADGRRGRGRVGAREQRLHPLRPGARPGRRRGAPVGRRGGRHRVAVRRGPGDGAQRLRVAVQGVHAVQQGLARARAGTSPSPAPRNVEWVARRQSDQRVARDARQGAGRGARGDADAPARTRRRDGSRPSSSATSTPTTTLRDDPGADRTSRLSPYLKLGVVHPRQLLAETAGAPLEGARPPSRASSRGGSSTPTCCTHFPDSAWSDLQPGRRADLRRAGGRDRGVADRAHRLPDRRRRDAAAAGRGLDAQPGADDHRQLPDQGPARVVAGRRAALPGPPRRRRPRLEQPRLAVGRRHRHRRRAVLPRLQPDHPGAEVRPAGRLRPPLGPRARPPRRQEGARAVGRRRRLRPRLPEADRGPPGGARAWPWSATSAAAAEGPTPAGRSPTTSWRARSARAPRRGTTRPGRSPRTVHSGPR